MAEQQSVLVRVPATTANLGPGFDCLGLALDIWNEIEFSVFGDALSISIEGEGSDSLPKDSSNLIYQCMQAVSSRASRPLPEGLHIKCRNSIPVSSGLGSSAAAVIAGLLGAKALLNFQIEDQELLNLALPFEGHADNISACLLGGLAISVVTPENLIVKKLSIEPLHTVIALPEISMSTHQARAALPTSIALQDAVFNIGRTALTVTSLLEGDYENLKIAMQDRLHQPYRFGLIPGAEAAISAALAAGAFGAALSGAGPSVIAFVNQDHQKVTRNIQRAFESVKTPIRIFTSVSSNLGAQVVMR